MCSTDIFLGLLALVFPPVAVWVKRGICSADSVINILLCVLGYVSFSNRISSPAATSTDQLDPRLDPRLVHHRQVP